MSAIKGMVLEIAGKEAIVLTDKGEFERIPLKGKKLVLGQEVSIELEKKTHKHVGRFTQWFVAAAAAVVVAIVPWTGLLTSGQAVAYVSLDINPSIELTVNDSDDVIKAEGLNPEGKRVLVERAVKGMDVEEAVETITEQALKDGYLKQGEQDKTVVLAVTPIDSEQQVSSLETELRSSIEKVVADNRLDVNVQSMVASLSLREKAREKGLSVAKYAILMETAEKGVKLDLSKVRNDSITKVIQDSGMEIDEIIDKVNEQQTIQVATHTAKPAKVNNTPKANKPKESKPGTVADKQQPVSEEGDAIVGPGEIASIDNKPAEDQQPEAIDPVGLDTQPGQTDQTEPSKVQDDEDQKDSDKDGILDKDEDDDNDGIPNGEEEEVPTEETQEPEVAPQP